jgi:hypothetical protein
MISVIPDVTIQNQNIDVDRLIVVYTGMENSISTGGGSNTAIEGLTPVLGIATLANTPISIVIFDGVPLVDGVDYSRVGAVVTFLTSTSNPIAIYTH